MAAKRNDRQRAKIKKLDLEMIQRGREITKMIRIFLIFEDLKDENGELLMPEGLRQEFRKVAVQYADRTDTERGSSYCKGKIDFRDAMHFDKDVE